MLPDIGQSFLFFMMAISNLIYKNLWQMNTYVLTVKVTNHEAATCEISGLSMG